MFVILCVRLVKIKKGKDKNLHNGDKKNKVREQKQ